MIFPGIFLNILSIDILDYDDYKNSFINDTIEP